MWSISRRVFFCNSDFEAFLQVVCVGGETDQRLDAAAEKLNELIVVNKEILMLKSHS